MLLSIILLVGCITNVSEIVSQPPTEAEKILEPETVVETIIEPLIDENAAGEVIEAPVISTPGIVTTVDENIGLPIEEVEIYEEETTESCRLYFGKPGPNKIKIFFISDDVNKQKFNETMYDFVKGRMLVNFKVPKHTSFLSVEPFASNKDKIIIYTIANDSTPLDCKPGSWGESITALMECDRVKTLSLVASLCPTFNADRDFVTVITDKADGGAGGKMMSFGLKSSFGLNDRDNVALTLKQLFLHEFGHSFGLLADEYIQFFRFDANPSHGIIDITGTSEININIDSAGCPKWCNSFKPVSEYTSSQCHKIINENECRNFGRINRECKKSSESAPDYKDCCVWFEEKQPYFNSNCVPAIGLENIGINCIPGAGCYFGALYGQQIWRSIRDKNESIMDDHMLSENYNAVSIRHLQKVFDCCYPKTCTGFPAQECSKFTSQWSGIEAFVSPFARCGTCTE